MSSVQPPPDEEVRLRAALEADILDAVELGSYDAVARVAADCCDAPIAVVSIADTNVMWFKGRWGTDVPYMNHAFAFCSHVVECNAVVVVEDAQSDDRFSTSPLVAGVAGVRSYSGVPIVTRDGRAIGAVGVMDVVAHTLGDRQLRLLGALAASVAQDIDLRRSQQEVQSLVVQVRERGISLERVTDTSMRLLSVIAHDIRGPLTSIVTLLSDSDFVAESSQEIPWILDEIRAQAIVGRDLLDQILSWARTMLRGGPTTMEDVDLHVIIDDVVRIHRENAERKATHIVVEHGVEHYDVDPNLIRFFVHTLVSNAVKFTEGGRITVRTRTEGSNIVIDVRDTGLGMPPNVRSRLFDWSRRGGIPGTRREKGAGLGLLLVKDFLDMMGGSIGIVSAPNDGTTVSISLPRPASSSS